MQSIKNKSLSKQLNKLTQVHIQQMGKQAATYANLCWYVTQVNNLKTPNKKHIKKLNKKFLGMLKQ